MRKIEPIYENPIDNFIYKLVEPSSEYFRHHNFTANDITTISLLFGLLSIYFLSKKDFAPFAILYFTSYIFDCLDGYYARKYKIVTKFGDIYDHVKDISIILGICGVIVNKYDHKKIGVFSVLLLAFFLMGMFVHLGYQECIYNEEGNKDETVTLSFTRFSCDKKSDRNMACYTRYLGCGTFVVAFIFLIYINFFYKL
jgi:phosphatidylglycerophosphate synthase